MNFIEEPMRFGLFSGPYHRPDISPLMAFQQDMELIENLDRVGFDEVWIGEHHSGGVETIACPELMIAAAAERTRHIKLGTGAVTIPYHNPFQVAERIVQLDYMTRGRMMFGVAPGQLVQDAQMVGLDPMNNRRMLQEALDVIIALFKGETVTKKTDWFNMVEARLQLLPYSNFDMACVSVMSPSGPITAGKYGMGMLSVAATNPVGVEMLLEQWQIVENESAKHGHVANRRDWRLLAPMHIAETYEQAVDDVRYGLCKIENYRDHINPGAGIDWSSTERAVEQLNENGFAVIGTPEMARAQIRRLQEKSGGFGCLMLMGADWASHSATLHSHELFAQEVIPYFRSGFLAPQKSFDEVMATGYSGAEITAKAQQAMIASYKQKEQG
jgi:limonene 1,2-monooxygenase